MSQSDLAPSRLREVLRAERLGRVYAYLPACGSTNDEAAKHEIDGAVVAAETQTAGRGRLGRAWHSPPGENLYVSLLLRPRIAPAMLPPLTLLAGAVTAEVLATLGAAPRLKWPNDVLLPGDAAGPPRKVAGILTEMASLQDHIRHVVIGLGINVNATSFPPALPATSLRLATGRRADRGALLATFLNTFEPAYDRFVAAGPADAVIRWRAHGHLPQRARIERDGTVLEGTAIDIDGDGALLVRDDDGQVHRVVSGEVAG